jgi:hypothetical protein
MTNEDLNKIAEVLPILAKYPTNYQAKSVAQQVQRLLNNNTSNRFKAVKNTNGGILQPQPKTQSQIIEDKRVSLLEAVKLREQLISNEDTSTSNEDTSVESIDEVKPAKKTRSVKYSND